MNHNTPCFRWQAGDLYLRLRVTPRAKSSEFCAIRNGAVQVRLSAQPVDGKANRALLDFLSRQFGVGRSRVELLKGGKSREKQVVIRKPQQLPSELHLKVPPETP